MNDLPYQQNISGCIDKLPAKVFSEAVNKALQALEKMRQKHKEGRLPHLDVVFEQDDLHELHAVAKQLAADCTDIMVFGTGGSSLAGQALQQIAQLQHSRKGESARETPKLHFLDNLESPWTERYLESTNPRTTRYLVISKSGTTAETITQMIMAIELLKKNGLSHEITRRMVCISQPDEGSGKNTLRKLAADHDIRVLDHPEDIGGRYSVFTVVGMLPAILLGLNPREIRAGAAQVVRHVLTLDAPKRLAPVLGAAVQYALVQHHHIAAMVTMPYTSRLRLFGAWLQQLWAESLGKKGFGTLPVTAIGPVDQHSQLQLYMDGPNDKLFNFICIAPTRESFTISHDYAEYTELAGLRISDLTKAQQEGTMRALLERERAVRVFHMSDIDMRSVGALFMHFIIETILVAYMHDIDPFDQPAVDLLKKHVNDLLPERPT